MYKDMPQLLSPTENGDFKLEHFEVRNGDIRAILSGVNPGNYVRLMHRGEVVMSDTYMEKRTNSSFCANAYGVVMSDNLEAMKDFRDFLAEHHIKNVASDSYTLDWNTKTITITAYAETKQESSLISSYIKNSPNKFKRLVQK